MLGCTHSHLGKHVVCWSRAVHISSCHKAAKLISLIYVLIHSVHFFVVTYLNTFFIKEELVPFCDENENSIHTPVEKLSENFQEPEHIVKQTWCRKLSENFQEPKHIVKQTWCRVLDNDLVIGLKVTSLNP